MASRRSPNVYAALFARWAEEIPGQHKDWVMVRLAKASEIKSSGARETEYLPTWPPADVLPREVLKFAGSFDAVTARDGFIREYLFRQNNFLNEPFFFAATAQMSIGVRDPRKLQLLYVKWIDRATKTGAIFRRGEARITWRQALRHWFSGEADRVFEQASRALRNKSEIEDSDWDPISLEMDPSENHSRTVAIQKPPAAWIKSARAEIEEFRPDHPNWNVAITNSAMAHGSDSPDQRIAQAFAALVESYLDQDDTDVLSNIVSLGSYVCGDENFSGKGFNLAGVSPDFLQKNANDATLVLEVSANHTLGHEAKKPSELKPTPPPRKASAVPPSPTGSAEREGTVGKPIPSKTAPPAPPPTPTESAATPPPVKQPPAKKEPPVWTFERLVTKAGEAIGDQHESKKLVGLIDDYINASAKADREQALGRLIADILQGLSDTANGPECSRIFIATVMRFGHREFWHREPASDHVAGIYERMPREEQILFLRSGFGKLTDSEYLLRQATGDAAGSMVEFSVASQIAQAFLSSINPSDLKEPATNPLCMGLRAIGTSELADETLKSEAMDRLYKSFITAGDIPLRYTIDIVDQQLMPLLRQDGNGKEQIEARISALDRQPIEILNGITSPMAQEYTLLVLTANSGLPLPVIAQHLRNQGIFIRPDDADQAGAYELTTLNNLAAI